MIQWPALRLDRHVGELAPLLVEVVAPCVARIRDEEPTAPVVVTAGWRGGPHLCLAARFSERRFREIGRTHLQPMIEAWYANNPTFGTRDAKAYEALCRKLARAELAPDTAPPPMAPDNSATFCSCERPVPYDCSALADVRDDFFSDSFAVAVALTRIRLSSRAEWLMQLVELFSTLGRIAPGGTYDFWPSSLFAHSTSFLAMYPDARDAFDTLTASNRTAIAFALVSSMDSAPANGWQTLWLKALRRLDVSVRQIVAENHAALSMYNVYGKREPVPSQMVNVPAKLLRTKTHLQYRLIINFVYATLPLIGVTPRERAWLCYAIAIVCKEDLTDIWDRSRAGIDALTHEADEKAPS